MSHPSIPGILSIGQDDTSGLSIFSLGNHVGPLGEVSWFCLADASAAGEPAAHVFYESGPDLQRRSSCKTIAAQTGPLRIIFLLQDADRGKLHVDYHTDRVIRLVGGRIDMPIRSVRLAHCTASLDGDRLTVTAQTMKAADSALEDLIARIEACAGAYGDPDRLESVQRLLTDMTATNCQPGGTVHDVPLWCFDQLQEILAQVRKISGRSGMSLAAAVHILGQDLVNLAQHLRTYRSQPDG